ncbi:HDOD domain-containing protein [Undibacterium rugosum]|uniref:HDOD domain-containing protein n=1 Tax=Undibacterium rugosum TaxID=2762291 RepID=A0A923IBX9_9BURK|nr:HDOD domain-containing protein [Undibacterium rugosum]MBC3936510.1 HDOD domain-containing protein [Undibacterium rugosum]MBR7780011.1 HDOD domain-containing protein [Undibacterium rugosum]
MDRLSMFKIIADQARQGQLVFPTHLEQTLKLKHLLDDPDCHTEIASKLISGEPLLSARIVAVANSAAYNRSGADISNIRGAVNRLGFSQTKILVTALIVRQLNQQLRDPVLIAKARQLWEHTVHVAALAQVIAKHITHVDPDTAMFAGLIHEVGGFYLISCAEQYPGIIDSENEAWSEYGEKLIGRGVLQQLEIPQHVIDAVEFMWKGLATYPPESLGDTLILANDIAPVSSPLHQHLSPAMQAHTAHLNFEVDESTLQEILQEKDEEIHSLSHALLN